MNKSYLAVSKAILKQMEQEEIPKIPLNRHQRRRKAKHEKA